MDEKKKETREQKIKKIKTQWQENTENKNNKKTAHKKMLWKRIRWYYFSIPHHTLTLTHLPGL